MRKWINFLQLIISFVFALALYFVSEPILLVAMDNYLILTVALWFFTASILSVSAYIVARNIFDNGIVKNYILGHTADFLKRVIIITVLISALAAGFQGIYGRVMTQRTDDYVDNYIKENSDVVMIVIDKSDDAMKCSTDDDTAKLVQESMLAIDDNSFLAVATFANGQMELVQELVQMKSANLSQIIEGVKKSPSGGTTNFNNVYFESMEYVNSNRNSYGDNYLKFIVPAKAETELDLELAKKSADKNSARVDIHVLKCEDIGTTETIETVKRDNIGVYVASDISGSMIWTDIGRKSIDATIDLFNSIEPDDYFGVCYFSEVIDVYDQTAYFPKSEFEESDIIALGDSIIFNGDENFAVAVKTAAEHIRNSSNSEGENIIILMSDGNDTEFTEDRLEEIVTICNNDTATPDDDISVHTVKIGFDFSTHLEQISEATGGEHYSVDSFTDDFVALYSKIYNTVAETKVENEIVLKKICDYTNGVYGSINSKLNSTYIDISFDREGLLDSVSSPVNVLSLRIMRIAFLAILGCALGILMIVTIDDRRIAGFWIVIQSIKSVLGAIIFDFMLNSNMFTESFCRLVYAVILMIVIMPWFMEINHNRSFHDYKADHNFDYDTDYNYGKRFKDRRNNHSIETVGEGKNEKI